MIIRYEACLSYAFNTLTFKLVQQTSVTILVEYIYIMSRIALADRQTFVNLVSAMAIAQNIPEKQIWEGILNQWCMRVRAHLVSFRPASVDPPNH